MKFYIVKDAIESKLKGVERHKADYIIDAVLLQCPKIKCCVAYVLNENA
jgi:hypothetical protein